MNLIMVNNIIYILFIIMPLIKKNIHKKYTLKAKKNKKSKRSKKSKRNKKSKRSLKKKKVVLPIYLF